MAAFGGEHGAADGGDVRGIGVLEAEEFLALAGVVGVLDDLGGGTGDLLPVGRQAVLAGLEGFEVNGLVGDGGGGIILGDEGWRGGAEGQEDEERKPGQGQGQVVDVLCGWFHGLRWWLRFSGKVSGGESGVERCLGGMRLSLFFGRGDEEVGDEAIVGI